MADSPVDAVAELTADRISSGPAEIAGPVGEDRRRRRPSREVRRLLIEEASRQFTQRGYAATTVKDLSAATGVAISVLCNHFPSKADLLREAVLLPFVDLVDSIGATWATLADEPGKEAQLIRSFIAELYDGLFEHRGALLTLIATQAELEPGFRSCLDPLVRGFGV